MILARLLFQAVEQFGKGLGTQHAARGFEVVCDQMDIFQVMVTECFSESVDFRRGVFEVVPDRLFQQAGTSSFAQRSQ